MVSKLEVLLTERLRQRREAALRCALTVLDDLEKAGVQAGIVGSLARGTFKAHSDVDFLILELAGTSASEVIAIIEPAMGGLPFDVIFRETVAAADLPELLEEAVYASDLRAFAAAGR